MLPAVVAGELQNAVREFLRSAFPIATPFFQCGEGDRADDHALIDDLIARPQALFKGPYLDIKLPFRLANTDELPFQHLRLPFTPYRHQHTAFMRLSDDVPQSTIVATGTGSGKTECFMLPVLDDCLQRRERGIKTLVIYPMNALATDQAKRFAREVAGLETKLTVGLYVGGEQADAQTSMGPDNVITCQKTLRQNPPDILLTNYKMLDFLLIRPKDRPIWRFNSPGMLGYLVVDELHTFDGAQGTDLACLIRRLRDHLGAGTELACVGTSATIGTEAPDALLKYASEVFATPFDVNSVVGEDRLTADEYLLGSTDAERQTRRKAIEHFNWPTGELQALDPSRYTTADDYLFHQARIWFVELRQPDEPLPALNAAGARERAEAAVALGELLHRHTAFHELVRAIHAPADLSALAEQWQQRFNLPEPGQAQALLASLLSLVAAARLWADKEHADADKWCQPLLQIRAQLWLRELRRMVCSVPRNQTEPATLQFADDLQDPLQPLHLPLLHCRECHMAAWGAVAREGENHQLDGDLQGFYQTWFGYGPRTRLLVPLLESEKLDERVQHFCRHCLRLQPARGEQACVECESENVLRVWVPDMLRPPPQEGPARSMCHHNCPDCGARDGLMVLGYRAATLTSVMTGRLFATPYNDDHKLIAFSDSVQDAAHRAGFLGANTWRQTVRQAMATWLARQPVALSLKAMSQLWPDFWREKIGHDGRFCGTFIAPNMLWRRDYETLKTNGALPAGSDLPDWVSKRLSWECFAEFGPRGARGRSLERTGTAAVGVDAAQLATDVLSVARVLREEVEALRDVADDAFIRFVAGWMHHMRQVGAIYDPVLDGYLANKGREYLLNNLRFMPGFGRSQRPPAAVTLQHVAPNFEALVLTSRDTWAVRWLKKTLADEQVFAAAEARQIFAQMLDGLTRAGWFVERSAAGESVYLLNPDRLLVSPDSFTAVCSACRHRVQFAPDVAHFYDQMPCLRPQCRGRLQTGHMSVKTERYEARDLHRLVPDEHTGLLPRDVREHVERSFIAGSEPWDTNLLSATPTLEMGIDIGSLSSVFLCSVPPGQANYLQRIGRAGRRDGNALAVTVANGQNHDLYFYSDPQEMITGAVHTPGVFLQALAVLERQLIAYCFTCWTATGIEDSAVPGQLRAVLDTVENKRVERFPYTLLAFVAAEQATLLSGFFALFDALDDEARAYLTRFVRGNERDEGALSWRLVNRLQQLVDERQSLVKKVRQLKTERERLEQLPEDEATRALIDEVTRERSALQSLLQDMNERLVLNFLTDEGLLPNYAFPEEGVTLQSVILRKRSREQRERGDSAVDKTAYSFQRPAQAALGELAPENRFYAVAHEMQIDQVDLATTRVEDWRFCDRCQYTERVDVADRHSACPRCGSPQWADAGQKRSVLRLRQVYSTVDARADRIGDEAEQRQPRFFNRQMLVDTPPDGSAGGFRLRSEVLPFGFEFLRHALFREVNFGLAGAQSDDVASTFSVAGHEQSRRGFRLCRHCGKVQKDKPRRNEILHSYTCKLRKHPEQAAPEDYFESLYLYRELKSEAIRILLPLSEVAYSDQALHSFIAALNLGLREYFHGDVHHLEVTDMREPPTNGGAERVYLVVYDRIPGGTGYLKELMREPDNLMQVLDAAYQRLIRCECNDDELRDGCYRCILAYRDARNMPTISRYGAAALLHEILGLRNQIEPVASLSSISTNALVESKLEQRFVDALAGLAGAQLSKRMINGKAGSLLTLPGADGRPMPWLVEHQVAVGPQDHVALKTRIDVLLSPARSEDADNYKPIAVYLDGLQYHHDRVADDVAKRTALLTSGRYWVYSLNWDDLPEPGTLAKPHDPDPIRVQGPYHEKLRAIYDGMAEGAGWQSAAQCAALYQGGGLARLEALLREPEQTRKGALEAAVFRGLTTLVPTGVGNVALLQKLEYELGENAPAHIRDSLRLDEQGMMPGGFLDALGNSLGSVELMTALPVATIKENASAGIVAGLQAHVCFDDREATLDDAFKAGWRAFWHACNQLQFLPGFSMATRVAVKDGRLDELWSTWQAMKDYGESDAAKKASDAAGDGWAQVFELSILEPAQIEALMKLGVPEPDVGVDLTDNAGRIVIGGDIVELCWHDQGVAILNGVCSEQPPGWRLLEVGPDLEVQMEELLQKGIF